MKDMGRVKNLSLLLRNLTLGYPTCLSLPGWIAVTIVPCPWSDEVVIFHPFVRFGEAWDKPDNARPRFEVKPSVDLWVTLVHMDPVVPCESQLEMLIKSINAA